MLWSIKKLVIEKENVENCLDIKILGTNTIESITILPETILSIIFHFYDYFDNDFTDNDFIDKEFIEKGFLNSDFTDIGFYHNYIIDYAGNLFLFPSTSPHRTIDVD